jgi:magnesium transporter
MFQGFNTTDATNTLSLLCGFLVIFSGVYLLNLSRKDPVGDTLLGSGIPGQHGGFEESAIPTDSLTAFGTRKSLQNRRSSGEGGQGSARHSRQHSWGSSAGGGRRSIGDREALMHDYALHDLAETSEDEAAEDGKPANGRLKKQKKIEDEEQGTLGPASQHPYGQQGPLGSAPRLSGSGRARERDQLQKPSGK